METIAVDRILSHAKVILVGGVAAFTLSACASPSPLPSTESPTPSTTRPAGSTPVDTSDQSHSETPRGTPQTSAPAESGARDDSLAGMVNADNAYEVCLDLLETMSVGPNAVPGGYSREKLSPEAESIIHQRQDGVFGVGIYGTEGESWDPDRRDYLLSCYLEGSASDPVWYDAGIGPSVEPNELPTQFEEYDIHAGA